MTMLVVDVCMLPLELTCERSLGIQSQGAPAHAVNSAHCYIACRQPNHPICIIKEAIVDYLEHNYPGRFTSFDDLYPIVSTKAVSQAHLTAALSVPDACGNHTSLVTMLPF